MKVLYFDAREYLARELDGFCYERSNTQRGIVKILFHSHRRHWDDKDGDSFAIPSKFMEEYLGVCRETFRRLNKKYKFFDVVGDSTYGKSRRLKYTQRTLELIDKFYSDQSAKKLMQAVVRNGRVIDRPLTAKELIKVGDLMIKGLIEVDMDALQHYVDNSSDRKRIAALDVMAHSNTKDFGYGVFVQDFKRSDNNRVTGVTSSLQNLDRDIREAALNGYLDYDVENCHFAILAENGKYPIIQDYVDNTREHRDKIAEDVGISYDNAKRCVLAMLYGANRGKSERRCAIASYIGKDKVDDFWDHSFVQNLYGECLYAAKDLLGVEKVDFKELSKALTTVESLVLAHVTEGTIIHVPMMDGWVSDIPYDCAVLEQRILERFNIKTRVKKRVIDYWGQFEKGA